MLVCMRVDLRTCHRLLSGHTHRNKANHFHIVIPWHCKAVMQHVFSGPSISFTLLCNHADLTHETCCTQADTHTHTHTSTWVLIAHCCSSSPHLLISHVSMIMCADGQARVYMMCIWHMEDIWCVCVCVCVRMRVWCFSVVLQCHLQASPAREHYSIELVAKRMQWPSIHSHHGIRDTFLCFLPLCASFCVCVCAQVLQRAQRTHKARIQGEEIALFYCVDVCVCVRVPFHFSSWQLKYHTSPVSHTWPFLFSSSFFFPPCSPPPWLLLPHFHFQIHYSPEVFLFLSLPLSDLCSHFTPALIDTVCLNYKMHFSPSLTNTYKGLPYSLLWCRCFSDISDQMWFTFLSP